MLQHRPPDDSTIGYTIGAHRPSLAGG